MRWEIYFFSCAQPGFIALGAVIEGVQSAHDTASNQPRMIGESLKGYVTTFGPKRLILKL
jgi:hypothetical protein